MRNDIKILIVLALSISLMSSAGCIGGNLAKNEKPVIVFAEQGWDSVRFHDAVAMFIVENAFGYGVEEVGGSTSVTYAALLSGEVDVFMEMWTDNLAFYDADVADGKIIELGTNFDDNAQGLYVPRYVIEGDAARGIEPLAPGLESVADLRGLKSVFKDAETPGKGRIYGAIPGWQVDEIVYRKYMLYGLADDYCYFSPGSDAALAAAFASAYEKGEPIVGYYWEPTWLMGKYDFILLKDAPYDPELFMEGGCEFPAVPCTICVSTKTPGKAPDVVEFLKKYRTSSEITSKALAYIADNRATTEDAAKWFLREYEYVWSGWLEEKQIKAVKAAL